MGLAARVEQSLPPDLNQSLEATLFRLGTRFVGRCVPAERARLAQQATVSWQGGEVRGVGNVGGRSGCERAAGVAH